MSAEADSSATAAESVVAAADGSGTDAKIVFIGGTGRSGTHVLATLLGRHSQFADVPIEARFHCNRRGLPALLSGGVTLEGFLEKLRGFWWHRVRVDGQPRGLYNLMHEGDFDAAIEGFAAAYHDDPVAACRGLFVALLMPVASAAGKPRLVEMSSHNVRAAQTLRRIFPDARFVHVVRDGRDSASSVTSKTWGPGTIIGGIDWWADRLRSIEGGVRGQEDGAEYGLQADRFRVVLLDDLVAGDREASYSSLLEFLDVNDDAGMREFFEGQMGPGAAHQGRWREGLGAIGRARVRRKYERTLRTLDREGNHVAPVLLDSYERSRGRDPAAAGA